MNQLTSAISAYNVHVHTISTYIHTYIHMYLGRLLVSLVRSGYNPTESTVGFINYIAFSKPK